MKRLMIALAIGALVLSMAGTGWAVTEINIYGASAQVSFWSSFASAWMQDPAGGGCPAGTNTMSFTPADGTPANVYYHGAKYFIAENLGACTLDPTGIRVRVGSYDSVDGIQAVLGNTNVMDVGGCTGNNRAQLNVYHTGSATYADLQCFPTTLGSADVSGTTLIQISEGGLAGPRAMPAPPQVNLLGANIMKADGSGFVDLRDFASPGDWIDAADGPVVQTCGGSSTVIDHHPVVVPFGFFANNQLVGGTSLASKLAGICTAGSTGCSTSTIQICNPAGGNCLTKNITTGAVSLTQAMVEQIFSGNVTNWNTYFPGFNAPIQVCMRVAGSGTMATFDAAVMRTNKVGPGLPVMDDSLLGNGAWFNNTTDDLMACVNSTPGAIGFADAEKGNSANTFGPITFNGAQPSAANIQNGIYDRFWSLEHIFEPDNAHKYTGYPSTAVTNLVGWASNRVPTNKEQYWSTSAAMKVHKVNDFAYPPVAAPYLPGVCY